MSTRVDLESLSELEATELIDFARRWEPYGGAGDDEVFVVFGVSLRQYRRRLASTLTPARCAELGAGLSTRLNNYAHRQDSPPLTAQ